MNLAALRVELTDTPGLDLDDDERDRLLNEGAVELAARADFTRKLTNIGPTVIGTAEYTVPTDLHRALRLSVAGAPYRFTDKETAEELTLGSRALRSRGVFYPVFDSAGVEKYGIYPVPTANGQAINLGYVYRPADMTSSSHEPSVPADFHRAVVDYAKGTAFGSLEDNTELESFYLGKFERAVKRLRVLRLARSGLSPTELPTEQPEEISA